MFAILVLGVLLCNFVEMHASCAPLWPGTLYDYFFGFFFLIFFSLSDCTAVYRGNSLRCSPFVFYCFLVPNHVDGKKWKHEWSSTGAVS